MFLWQKMNYYPTEQNTLSLLREPAEDKQGDLLIISEEDNKGEKEFDPEKFVLCRQCHQVVTSKNNRINRDGAHRHTYANPSGQLFEIGCFQIVTGCEYVGALSYEFTWFKGFSWRMVVCEMCLTHLGWFFVSSVGDRFHGLILNRLIDSGAES